VRKVELPFFNAGGLGAKRPSSLEPADVLLPSHLSKFSFAFTTLTQPKGDQGRSRRNQVREEVATPVQTTTLFVQGRRTFRVQVLTGHLIARRATKVRFWSALLRIPTVSLGHSRSPELPFNQGKRKTAPQVRPPLNWSPRPVVRSSLRFSKQRLERVKDGRFADAAGEAWPQSPMRHVCTTSRL
jgi:hypothetical protein